MPPRGPPHLLTPGHPRFRIPDRACAPLVGFTTDLPIAIRRTGPAPVNQLSFYVAADVKLRSRLLRRLASGGFDSDVRLKTSDDLLSVPAADG
ncbi:MAG: hypothetical protein ACYS0G_12650, partial [Planctomycetota bacterium]